MNIKTFLKYQYLVILPLCFCIDLTCNGNPLRLEELAREEIIISVIPTIKGINDLPIPRKLQEDIALDIDIYDYRTNGPEESIEHAHSHFLEIKSALYGTDADLREVKYRQLPDHPFLSATNEAYAPIIHHTGHFFSQYDEPLKPR